MKFPLKTSSEPHCWSCVFDADDTLIARAWDAQTGKAIVDALTLQHAIAGKVPVHAKKAAPDIGSIPARDITYRQKLIGEALAGICNTVEYPDAERVARIVPHVVDELLKQMAEEAET